MTRPRTLSRPLRAAPLALLALAALPAALSGPRAAEGRAFTVPDHYRVKAVGSPAVSPDGSLVVFQVRRTDLEADESWSELWRMRPDGSEARQLTFGKHTDSGAVFTPDGRSILFTSNRAEGSQVFVMAVDGGEPRQLTSFPGGVSDPVPSPDGRFVAVSAEVFAEAGADPEANEEQEGKLSVHVADELLYRHWTSWRDGRYTHVLLVDAESGKVVRDLTPGRFDAPTFSLGGERGYAFSPDGAELCFVSNHEPDAAESTNTDLWVVPVEPADGETPAPRNLTDANDGWDGAPLYSPSGAHVAFVSQEEPGYESDLRRLAVLERATGNVRYLTSREGFDDWVGEIAWDGEEALVFSADRRGRNPLFRIPLAGGEPEEVLAHAQIDHWELLPGGERVVYARRSVGEPHELWTAPLGGAPARLTHFNDELAAEVDFRPAEELWVEGEDGTRIHVFLVKPHGFDPARRWPLILNVHGGPQSQWTDAYRGDWQVYPGAGYAVAFANPTGSTGYGQPFTDAIGGDWGGRVYRDLMRVTDLLVELPWVDPERVGVMGWSYGGYMMMWMQGHTDRFACQAAMMGLFDLPSFYGATEELWFPEHDVGVPWENREAYARWSPSSHVESFSTPALVITGERDYRVPYTQSLGYFTALQKRDVPSRLVVFPGAGHWPSWREMAFYYVAHLDWFHRWLGGDPPPHDLLEHQRAKGWPRKEEGKSGSGS